MSHRAHGTFRRPFHHSNHAVFGFQKCKQNILRHLSWTARAATRTPTAARRGAIECYQRRLQPTSRKPTLKKVYSGLCRELNYSFVDYAAVCQKYKSSNIHAYTVIMKCLVK